MMEAKEKNISVKARYSKVLFCGSSAVGKSNFINLLLKKRFEVNHNPTRVTESHQLLAKQITIVSSEHDSSKCELEYLDFENQIKWLKWFLKSTNSDSTENMPQEQQNQPAEVTSSALEDINTSANVLKFLPTEDRLVAKSNVDLPPGKPPDVWNILTFLDTGGQPAFINMLPAVNSSAMITFIIHSMEGGVDSLKNKVSVYGEGTSTYSLDYDHIDLIKMLFSMRKPKELQMFEELLVDKDNKGDKNCYLSLVGTKSDLCDNSDVVAKNIYKELKPIITQTIRSSSLIPVGGKYFVPVSNCNAGTDEEDPTADKVRCCIYEQLLKRDVFYIPIVWLILELEIQNRTKEENVIHFDDIFKFCKEYNLITNEANIRTALRFFHHIGVFLYYSSDDSEMKDIADIVITNYQWLFENLTQIIKAAKSNDDVTEDLKYNGRLNNHVINHIEWKLGKNVSEKYFLKLLEKLAIISPTKRTGEYFMPCILSTFPFNTSNEDNLFRKYGDIGKTDPLLMQLVYEESDAQSHDQNYLFPVGVFCCLINLLLMNDYRFIIQWSDLENDNDPCVFNNVVIFYDEIGKCYVVLINRFMYLEVQIRYQGTIQQSVYPEIKSTIKFTLKGVCDKLKLYVAYICVGFHCSTDGILYWTRRKYGDQNKDVTLYSKYQKPKQLEERQRFWFSGRVLYIRI